MKFEEWVNEPMPPLQQKEPPTQELIAPKKKKKRKAKHKKKQVKTFSELVSEDRLKLKESTEMKLLMKLKQLENEILEHTNLTLTEKLQMRQSVLDLYNFYKILLYP